MYINIPKARLLLGLNKTFLCKIKLISLHRKIPTITTIKVPSVWFNHDKPNKLKFLLGSASRSLINPIFTPKVFINNCTINPAMLKTIKKISCKKPFIPFFFFGASGSLSASLFLTARSWS